MDEDQSSPAIAPRTPLWLLWARALLVIAMSGAGYLARVAIHNGPAAGCGPASGCEAVLHSRWAYWLDLPVSVPALLVYLALLAFTVLLQKRPSPDDQRGSWAAIVILSVIIAGSAFWFVSLQVFVIQAFCKYCLTAHVCGFAAALLCLMNIPYATDPDTPMWATGSGKRGVPPQSVLSLVLIGLAGVGILAGGQILVQKERNVVKDLNHQAATGNTNQPGQPLAPSTIAASPTPSAHLIALRTLSLYTNQFVIRLDDVPVMGSRDATNIIVCLVDYTCIHCRALHPILTKMSQQFSNELGIVCLPVTMSPECNPFIPKQSPNASTNSCEYARLGLAVWRAKPALHRQFDDWMFAKIKPPPLAQAMDRAAQLLGGEDQLKAALSDPWVKQQILTDAKIHRANWLAADSSALPQIVLGNSVSSGPVNSMQHLQILLARYMGLNLGPNGF